MYVCLIFQNHIITPIMWSCFQTCKRPENWGQRLVVYVSACVCARVHIGIYPCKHLRNIWSLTEAPSSERGKEVGQRDITNIFLWKMFFCHIKKNFFFNLCNVSEIVMHLATDMHIYCGSVLFFSKTFTEIASHLTISSTYQLRNMLCIFLRIFSIAF